MKDIDNILLAHKAERQERKEKVKEQNNDRQVWFLVFCMGIAILSLPFI